jgi:CheY-like chemotaxis protein
MGPVSPRSERVLVVEDEDPLGEIVTEALADEGYEVRRARHGREALAILGSWLPAVIVLDLMMPLMDGHTFRAAQRRLEGGGAEVPIIVVSGARDAGTRAAELGAVDVLKKPFELDDLVDAVGRWSRSDPAGST